MTWKTEYILKSVFLIIFFNFFYQKTNTVISPQSGHRVYMTTIGFYLKVPFISVE